MRTTSPWPSLVLVLTGSLLLPSTSSALPRVDLSPSAVTIELEEDQISAALEALTSNTATIPFPIHVTTSVPLNEAITGKYSGSPLGVVKSLLDKYNYYVLCHADLCDVVVLSRRSAVAAQSSAPAAALVPPPPSGPFAGGAIGMPARLVAERKPQAAAPPRRTTSPAIPATAASPTLP
jgi:hypothetical protein